MDLAPTVVALCGSVRDESYTRIALRHALDAAEEAGGETRLIDLGRIDLPLFDPDFDEQGDSAELRRAVREADAVLLGTPVYHGSYSSALKSALDYLGSDEFEDTTVGLLATAGGGTYSSALDHMRVVARGVHAWVLPRQVGIRRASAAFEGGEDGSLPAFADERLTERVATLGREAVEYARIEPTPVRTAETDGSD